MSNSVERKINIHQALSYSSLKKTKKSKKQKKITNINYLIIVLLKIRL